MASKKRRVTKKSSKAPKTKAPKRGRSGDLGRRAPKNKVLPKRGSTPRPATTKKKSTRSSSSAKAAATRGAAERRKETEKFQRAASKRYGKNAETTRRLKELTANARRWELEARKSKTLSGKKRARANASKALAAARNTFKAATREKTKGQAKARGWVEVERFDKSGGEVDTFTSYEHARHGAGSVLSLLESRPGVVGVHSWRRVSQIERDGTGLTARGELTPELKERADSMAKELGLSGRERDEFEQMLIEAELYGVELELEVENYSAE